MKDNLAPFPAFDSSPSEPQLFRVEALPRFHEAEAEVYARHLDIPGHDQQVLGDARFVLVGGGGIGSIVGLGLVRSGARHIAIVEPDTVDRTNLTRQFYYQSDLSKKKALRLADNLLAQATDGAEIVAIPRSFQEAVAETIFPADVLLVGVDNNACRLAAARYGRQHQIPVVFTMLSADGGLRCISFLQGPDPADPCLWCALPDLDPARTMPCVAAIITGGFLAAATTTFFAHRAVMGWPKGQQPFNWREIDLTGRYPDVVATVAQRTDCEVCRC
jgi:adenylyltransferase/sulfurtransferase